MFKLEDTFNASKVDEPRSKPWPYSVAPLNSPAESKFNFTEEADLKKLFAVEWAKNPTNPFEAALVIFKVDTGKALWVSKYWLTDPIVIAAKDVYLENLNLDKPLLDKNQLAAKVLQLAEEKTQDGTRYIHAAEDRLKALKLYSDIVGYTGKVDIDASTKIFKDNQITLRFVDPDPEPPVKEDNLKIIDQTPNKNSKNLNEDHPSPIELRLIG